MAKFEKRFVRNTGELKEGMKRFDLDIGNVGAFSAAAQHDIREFMRRTRAVYAVKNGAGYLVCGGKFCGYHGLDVETYSRERINLNGGHAHAHIRGWADQVSGDHPAHKAWATLCAAQGVKPAPSFETFLIREEASESNAIITPVEGKVVDLIVQLTAMLAPSSRDNLKTRIAAL